MPDNQELQDLKAQLLDGLKELERQAREQVSHRSVMEQHTRDQALLTGRLDKLAAAVYEGPDSLTVLVDRTGTHGRHVEKQLDKLQHTTEERFRVVQQHAKWRHERVVAWMGLLVALAGVGLHVYKLFGP